MSEDMSDLLKDRDRLWDIATQSEKDKSSLVDEITRLRAALSERDALLGEANTAIRIGMHHCCELHDCSCFKEDEGWCAEGMCELRDWKEKYARIKSAGEEGT